MLGEPERTQYDLNFWLFGFPVRVHPFFWLVAVLLGMQSRDPVDILIWVASLFLAILFHELGHAVAMRAFGFRPWIVLYGMGGLTSCDPSSASGRRMTRWRNILTCFAGPLAGFLLAAAIVGGIVLAGQSEHLFFVKLFPGAPRIQPWLLGTDRPRVDDFVNNMLFICVMWGFVNLLPIYPLDGGQISRELFTMADPARGLRGSLMLSFVAAVVVAAVGAVLWRSIFVALLFAYFAYNSYMMLQAVIGRERW